jgi:hypothetical protein
MNRTLRILERLFWEPVELVQRLLAGTGRKAADFLVFRPARIRSAWFVLAAYTHIGIAIYIAWRLLQVERYAWWLIGTWFVSGILLDFYRRKKKRIVRRLPGRYR